MSMMVDDVEFDVVDAPLPGLETQSDCEFDVCSGCHDSPVPRPKRRRKVKVKVAGMGQNLPADLPADKKKGFA